MFNGWRGENGKPARDGEIRLYALPWLEPRHSPLGLGIVTRLLRESGRRVVVDPVNVRFFTYLADQFGSALAGSVFAQGNAGEILAGACLAQDACDPARLPCLSRPRLARLREIGISRTFARKLLRSFLDFTFRTLEATPWDSVSVCGFSLSIDQTVASLLWSREIKRRFPRTQIVFGGSQCAHPMGPALLEAWPFVDGMGFGECDGSIVAAFDAMLEGTVRPVLPNFGWRVDGVVLCGPLEPQSPGVLASPDYTEYGRAYHAVYERTGEPANYYLEASRGCWWGEKHHCTFCGIHARDLSFRAKDSNRVLAEVRDLLAQHQTVRVAFSDTIMAREHLSELLPSLEQLRTECDAEFVVDLKPNLSRGDAARLARAGFVAVQLGIESLSTRLLQLMRKGNRGLQHIQTLRWLAEAGIWSYYHILTHVPGETPADYDETLGYMAGMRHLPPPSGVFPIELNRFAPYFERWHEFGFDPPRPHSDYQWKLSGVPIDLMRFAYAFAGQHPSTDSPELDSARRRVSAEVEQWKSSYEQESFYYWMGVDRAILAREGSSPLHTVLEGVAGRLFVACDSVRNIESLEREFQSHGIGRVRGLLGEWGERGIVALSPDGQHAVALPVHRVRLRPRMPVPSNAPELGTPEVSLIALARGKHT